MKLSESSSYIFLTLAQCCVGANIVIAKVLMPFIPIYVLLSFRFFIGTLILSGVCYFKKESPFRDNHNNKLVFFDGMVLFVKALCAGFLFNSFILSGLQYTEASTAGIISSITPAVIAFLSYALLKEKLGPRRIAAIVLAVLGLIVISMDKGHSSTSKLSWFGDLLVLFSVFPEALFTVIAKWYKKDVGSYSMALVINFFNLLLFIPIAISSIKYIHYPFQLSHVALAVLYGVLGGLFFPFWYRGLKNTTASMAAMFTSIMPIAAAVLAFLVLGEKIGMNDIIGAVLVIASIFLGSLSFKRLKVKTLLLND